MDTLQDSSTGLDGTTTSQPLLEVRDITRVFGPVHALRGVSLKVQKGEVVGLIGENGAGKSTLLNIISGTDKQTSGSVILKGTEVS